MNKNTDEIMHVVNILEDLIRIEKEFTVFSDIKSYDQFHKLAGEMMRNMNVLSIHAEYETFEEGSVEWLTLSTGLHSYEFHDTGVKLIFEYRCAYSNNCDFLVQDRGVRVEVDKCVCTLEDAVELLLAKFSVYKTKVNQNKYLIIKEGDDVKEIRELGNAINEYLLQRNCQADENTALYWAELIHDFTSWRQGSGLITTFSSKGKLKQALIRYMQN